MSLTSVRKLVQRKIYQLEVTLAIYMFTPREKFAFYSIVFLLMSLTFIATVLYLPRHISVLAGRAWYYINGDHIDVAASAREVVKEMQAGVLAQVMPGAVAGTTSVVVVKEAVETVAREL